MGRRNIWRRDMSGVARARVGDFRLESARAPDGDDFYWRLFGADGAMLRAMRGFQTEWDARQASEDAADEMPSPSMEDNVIRLSSWRREG